MTIAITWIAGLLAIEARPETALRINRSTMLPKPSRRAEDVGATTIENHQWF